MVQREVEDRVTEADPVRRVVAVLPRVGRRDAGAFEGLELRLQVQEVPGGVAVHGVEVVVEVVGDVPDEARRDADLPLEHAFAACIAATVAAERRGEIGDYKASDIIAHQRWLVGMWAERETTRRDVAEHRIKRALRPMIAVHKPWGTLMSEAHGINGEAQYPLTEDEVSDMVRIEVWFSLPAAPRRHVR